MSLHNLAHHLQSAGRGEDKVLVHMTPGEVQGLQSLAMAHGGSLTINPQTGLPEAGFLSAILPIAAGFFLGPAGVGIAESALGAAAMVGGATTLATGSLGKGLMAGFGAYGGFGMGEGLMAAGANAMPGVAASGETAANLGAQGSAFNIPAENLTPSNFGAEAAGTNAATNTGINSLNGGYTGYTSPFANPNVMAANPYGLPTTPPVDAANMISNAAPVAPVYTPQASLLEGGAGTARELQSVATNTPVNNIDQIMGQGKPPSTMDQLGAGVKDVTSSGAKAWDFVKEHPAPFIGAGIGALQDYQEQKAADAAAAAKAATGPSYIRPYEFSTAQNASAYAPNPSTSERQFFVQPRYTAQPIQQVKEGGLMGIHKYAVGGAVEQMSAQNAVGDNTMYPQSQLQTAMYSNPMVQRPVSTNVIKQGTDLNVDPYTGEQKMADGGSTSYSYDPKTQQYTQSTTATPSSTGTTQEDIMRNSVKNFYAPVFGGMFNGMNSMLPPMYQKLLGQQAAPQPTVTTQTSGGIQTPYMQQAQPQTQPANPIIPNINIPQQQDVNKQLGLEAFYPMMEQQLALKGAQMQARGMADGGMASGGYNLGGYSDGGRLLRGPGDGVSDSIPASIGNRQPARLADGEFVVPARIVSEIGNGSTEAGARKLYAMMDRVQKARGKTVGKNKVAVNTKADKLLPA